MSKKKTNINFDKLEVGTSIEAKDCILSNQLQDGEFIRATLTDSTGEIPCSVNKDLLKDFSLLGVAEITVRLDGVFTYKRGVKNLWITKIEKSDAVIQKPNESLSSERIQYYIDWIDKVTQKITHPGYKALIQTILTKDLEKKLSTLPATLASGAQYPGGALQMTATVLRFCAMVGCDYVRFGNGNYTKGFDFDALFTAALIQLYGNVTYYYLDEQQGKILKTANGLNSGYYAMLSFSLKEIILKNEIPITDAELSFLLNILGASVRGGRNGVQPISAEGALLRAMNEAFVNLDMYNAEYARLTKLNTGDYGENVPYLYSDRLDAYIVVGQRPERKEGDE